MDKKRLNLEEKEKQNPFRIPEGYMEGITDRIMDQLPEKKTHVGRARRKSLFVQLRPWVSIAAALIGIGFFVNVFIGIDNRNKTQHADSLWVQSQMPTSAISQASGDDDYLDYLEVLYSDYILEEELTYSE